MTPDTLLADPAAIRLNYIRPSASAVKLVVKTIASQVECPRCRRSTSRMHSRYLRLVADLPWHGVAVKLELHTRRFLCLNSLCIQRIFCERLPTVVARYARKTVSLNAALELIGFAVGGEAGSRLARELGLIVSPDTLLRRLREASEISSTTTRIIGVDDFAFRRGRRYGSLLVDLERHRPVDLLPDRESATLGAWLRAHPGIEVVTRDRSKTYARGISQGAPSAVQVADRWHLLKNLRDALEQLLKRVLSSKGRGTRGAVHPPEESIHALSEYTEQSRIRLLPHLLRLDSGGKRAPPLRPPPPREAAWMLLQSDRLKDEERLVLERLCYLFPDLKAAQELALDFAQMVRHRAADLLPGWLRSATQSKLKEFVGFARGLSEDYEAVRNALKYEWSNGQLEGQVNRLKLIKRQMYGRAKFDLLRARVLHSLK
ncbi:MAG: ISL3 family transposase [Pyrinomonadaceae bacterium]|nr:ISL3 family transposase [Pyrinomonadaceae bacterium]